MNVGIEKENYAIPIYQDYVHQAKKLSPKYLSMIIQARWYAGGRKELNSFRSEMLNDNRITILHDYPNSNDIFPGTQIKAGVCYFLWERYRHSNCSITTHLNGKEIGPIVRPLLEKGSDTFIRYNQAISIIRKVNHNNQSQKNFSTLVSPQTPFGIITSYKGTENPQTNTDLKMYISGNDTTYKGKSNYAPLSKVTKGQNLIPCHKVYIPKAGSGSDSFPHQILGKPFYGEPNSICNQTYLVIGPFETVDECNNVISYISTKLFRFLVLQKKNSQDAMRGVYQFVPLQDFSKPWTDAELYEKYGLSQEEIDFIESMIKPME
jgi:site-specific DNA-methyltransferase (adenine-specific)